MMTQHDKHYVLVTIVALLGVCMPITSTRAEALTTESSSTQEPVGISSTEVVNGELVHGSLFLLIVITAVALSRIYTKHLK